MMTLVLVALVITLVLVALVIYTPRNFDVCDITVCGTHAIPCHEQLPSSHLGEVFDDINVPKA